MRVIVQLFQAVLGIGALALFLLPSACSAISVDSLKDDASIAQFWINKKSWQRALPYLERLAIDGKASAKHLWERARCRQELGQWARGLLDYNEFLAVPGPKETELFKGDGPKPKGYKINQEKLRLWLQPNARRLILRQHLRIQATVQAQRVFRFRLSKTLNLRSVKSGERQLLYARRAGHIAIEFPWISGDGTYEFTVEAMHSLGNAQEPHLVSGKDIGVFSNGSRSFPLKLIVGAPGGWEVFASGNCLGRHPTNRGTAGSFKISSGHSWLVGFGKWTARSRPSPQGPIEVYLRGDHSDAVDSILEAVNRIVRYLRHHFGSVDGLGGIRLVESPGVPKAVAGVLCLPTNLIVEGITIGNLAEILAQLWWPDREGAQALEMHNLRALRSYVANLVDQADGGLVVSKRMEHLRVRLYDTGGERPPESTRAMLALHRLRGQVGNDSFKKLLIALRPPKAQMMREGRTLLGSKVLRQWRGYVQAGQDVDLKLGRVQSYRIQGDGESLLDHQGKVHRFVSKISLKNRGRLRYEGPVQLILRTAFRSHKRRVRLGGENGTYYFSTAHPLVEVSLDPQGWIVERDLGNNARKVSPRIKSWRDWQKLQG